MKNYFKISIATMMALLCLTSCQSNQLKKNTAGDPGSMVDNHDSENLYLEDVRGEKAIQWVEKHNQSSLPKFENDPRMKEISQKTLSILDDPKKLINAALVGDWAYNFWQDEKNVRGLWRRMPIGEYLKRHREWDVLLDVDELAKKENKNWIFKGAQLYKNRVLLSLSDGGKDAHTIREFDTVSKAFVVDGFNLPEGKNDVQWISENELFLGLALKPEEVTDSGYPRQVRRWKRGEVFADTKVLFSGTTKDMHVGGYASRDEDNGPARYLILSQAFDFYHSEVSILRADGTIVKLALPKDVGLSGSSIDGDEFYMSLKSDWLYHGKKYLVGSLIRFNLEKFIQGNAEIEVLFTPTKTQFLQQFEVLRGRVFLILSNDVTGQLVEVLLSQGSWTQKVLPMPKNSSIDIVSRSKKLGVIIFSSEEFISPKTIFSFDLASSELKTIDHAPSYFDASLYQVEQFFTQSKDGTRVPYYVLHGKNMRLDGKNPTIINAYGGFEYSMNPHYLPVIEQAWLKNGGVWILANIRGGSEYGPEWHTSAIEENRQRVYDDFFAVAEDVIRKKISSPEHLGAVGGSNGGLLMGVALTQRPELFSAICVQVPLLDMLRYHHLLAGASWMGEYGNPDDPKERAFIAAYSPYQNIKATAKYPEAFFMTSTADDRVHPGHARRTAAKMEAQGHPFYYYENTEGGHGGSANHAQYAHWTGLEFTYFLQKLVSPK